MINDDVKLEEGSTTGYVGYVNEPKTRTEQATEANTTSYVVAPKMAIFNAGTGYAKEYLKSPEDNEEKLEIGDRIIEILSGMKGVVVGFKDGRVVFELSEHPCSFSGTEGFV